MTTTSTVPVLEIDGLGVRLPDDRAARPVLDGVSLTLRPGETVGLVGESGSGKSVACRSVLGLLPRGARTSGQVRVSGRDVLTMTPKELTALRAREVAMVFQDPRASVNPLRRVGDFLTEGLRAAGTPAARATGVPPRRGRRSAGRIALVRSAGTSAMPKAGLDAPRTPQAEPGHRPNQGRPM